MRKPILSVEDTIKLNSIDEIDYQINRRKPFRSYFFLDLDFRNSVRKEIYLLEEHKKKLKNNA
jgi:hypothetical protein